MTINLTQEFEPTNSANRAPKCPSLVRAFCWFSSTSISPREAKNLWTAPAKLVNRILTACALVLPPVFNNFSLDKTAFLQQRPPIMVSHDFEFFFRVSGWRHLPKSPARSTPPSSSLRLSEVALLEASSWSPDRRR